MDLTLQDHIPQRFRHLTIVFLLRTSAILEQAQMALGLASVILIFLIFVSLNTIMLFSALVSCLEAGSCRLKIIIHLNLLSEDVKPLISVL